MKKDNKLELIDPTIIATASNTNANVIIQTAGVVTVVKEWTDQELEYLQIRKDLELEAIQRLDKTTIIPRKECWYIMDSKWLNKWTDFVQHEGPPRKLETAGAVKATATASQSTEQDKRGQEEKEEEEMWEGQEPGPVTTRDLFDVQTGQLHKGLQPNLDYR